MKIKITISINKQSPKSPESSNLSPIFNIKEESQKDFIFEPDITNNQFPFYIYKLKSFFSRNWKKLGILFLILCALLEDKFIWAKVIVQGFFFIVIFSPFLIVIGLIILIILSPLSRL